MNFLQKFKNVDKSLLLAFLALGLVVLMMQIFSSKTPESEPRPSEESFDVDTMIPAGFLLIPLELSNAESLASLTGQFSVVDLYASGGKERKGYKIAAAVKLLRAPLNPQQFAVLVREEESAKIATHEGPFFAALKNPKEVAKSKPRNNPLIIQYGE